MLRLILSQLIVLLFAGLTPWLGAEEMLTPDEIKSGWLALFDRETAFGFSGAKTELRDKKTMLRGGETTTQFSNYELVANVIEAGTLSLGEQSHAVQPGLVRLESRRKRGTIRLSEKLLVASLALRPLDLKPLINGKDFAGWEPRTWKKTLPEKQPKWTIENGAFRAVGGPGALEYAPAQQANLFADLILQIDVRTLAKHTNGGLFFRNQPGTTMMGYEAQLHNRLYDTQAGETGCWTGAIDDRQHARRLVSVDHVPFRMTVVAHGRHIATWVNGYQTTDWTDDRAAHENPRSGCRVEPGTIQLQAHDPETDIEFRQVLVRPLGP